MDNNFDYNNQINPNSQPQPQYVTYIPYGFTPETYEEKRAVKKIANIIGGALLIMSAVPEFIVAGLKFLLSILGLWGVKELEFFYSGAFNQYLNAILSILMFTIPFILLFKVNGYRISSLVKFKKPKKSDVLPYFFLGLGVCYFSNFAVSVAGGIFESFGFDYDVSGVENPSGVLGFMLTFISIAVVPPLVEEFACRGFILSSLRKYGDSVAILVSALLFGIMHGNFEQIPFAFIVGLVLGFITVKTNSIWVAVAVHAANNGISVVLDYIITATNEEIANVFAVIFLTACVLFIFVGMLLLKNKKNAYKVKKCKAKSSQKQIFKWFFTAPTIIIFIVISLLKSLQYF